MKTIVRTLCLAGLILPGLLEAAEMSVQTRQAPIRSTPSYVGKPVGTAAYGDRVTVLQAQGDWRKVQAGAIAGWLHQSALTEKKIVLQAGATDVATTASGEELSLAGKGFNSDVEADFKKRNAAINFAPIDRMEKIRIQPAEAQAFLQQGGLKGGGS